MPGAVWVQACDEASFDTSTGICAAPYWTLQQSSVPAITIAEANLLGAQVALILALAWGFKKLRQALA